MAKIATTDAMLARNRAAAKKRKGEVKKSDLPKIVEAFTAYMTDIQRLGDRLEKFDLEVFSMDGVMKVEQASQALAEWIALAEAAVNKQTRVSRLETSFLNGDTD